MVKQTKIQKIPGKSCLAVGAVLMVVLIGAGGCSPSKATAAATTSTTSTTSTTQAQPTTQGQRVRNPALQAAMEIRRLQSDPKNVLTSDQKDKIKPILQDLIKTPNPGQDILQQKADAINAVLTDQQKSSVATQRPSNGTKPQNGTGSGTGGGAGSGTGSKQAGNASNPQDMYQQVLDSLK